MQFAHPQMSGADAASATEDVVTTVGQGAPPCFLSTRAQIHAWSQCPSTGVFRPSLITRSLGAAASGAPAPSSQQRKRGKPQDLAGGITCKFCRKKPCRFGPRCPAPAAGEPAASHPVPAEPGPAQAVPAEPVTAEAESVTSFGPSAPMDLKQVFRRQDSNVRTACARWGAPTS